MEFEAITQQETGALRAAVAPRAWLLAIIGAMLLTMPGCGGCDGSKPKTAAQKKKEEEEQRKEEAKKKKAKPDFEATDARIEPADPQSVFNYYKPGHWISTEQAVRANNFDFSATVEQRVVASLQQRPLRIDGTKYSLTSTRPAALAKGQARFIESLCLPPLSASGQAVMLKTDLLQRRAGNNVFTTTAGTTRMKDFQYLFLVLSSLPDNYTYVKTLPTVQPTVSDDSRDNDPFYRVVVPRIDRRVSAPTNAFSWSSVSYVLWDRVNADLMTAAQKQAMIDWLHWGGQLIINGPGNLDALKTTFLNDYLPCDDDGSAELTAADFDELNAYFSLASTQRKEVLRFELLDDQKLLGVRWKLRPEGYEVPQTGGLVAERRVGRGRVVTTAFSLTSRQFKRWPCADNFFNGCLLRRPARRFVRSSDYTISMSFAGLQNKRDPRLGSRVRYLSRDLPELRDGASGSNRFGGFDAWPERGNGGWNDGSGVSNAARSALEVAAGIEVPDAGFVLKAMGFYLLVLVPLNWLVFRLMGRVEWAWVAAPVIAVIGSVFVVRYAQLDIGFSRSLTEAAILELQPDYDRGHLTRYTALYTSLATNYEVVMDDSSAVAAPFPADLNYEPQRYERTREVTLRRGSKVTLGNYQVDSSSTGMLHAEQMLDIGRIALVDAASGQMLANQTALQLRDAMVVRRSRNGRLEKCFLGLVEPSTTRPVEFQPASGGDLSALFPEWDHPNCAFSPSAGGTERVSLREMAQLAIQQLRLAAGESRLVAWSDAALPGAQVSPTPDRAHQRTAIVAHLIRPPLGRPDSDPNLLLDLIEDPRDSIDQLFEEPAEPAEPAAQPNGRPIFPPR